MRKERGRHRSSQRERVLQYPEPWKIGAFSVKHTQRPASQNQNRRRRTPWEWGMLPGSDRRLRGVKVKKLEPLREAVQI